MPAKTSPRASSMKPSLTRSSVESKNAPNAETWPVTLATAPSSASRSDPRRKTIAAINQCSEYAMTAATPLSRHPATVTVLGEIRAPRSTPRTNRRASRRPPVSYPARMSLKIFTRARCYRTCPPHTRGFAQPSEKTCPISMTFLHISLGGLQHLKVGVPWVYRQLIHRISYRSASVSSSDSRMSHTR